MPVRNDAKDVQRDTSRGWHVLYTLHQHEKLIAEILSNKGFEVFLPLYTAIHTWKDRKKELSLPLFPCYVFLWGGQERRLDILTTPGIFSFVGINGRPAIVPSEEIDAIRRATETSLRMEPYPFLQHGERVRVKSGPFEGIEGILTLKKSVYRLVLTVELLGKSAAVEIDRSMVERALTPVSRTASHPPPSSSPVLSRGREAAIKKEFPWSASTLTVQPGGEPFPRGDGLAGENWDRSLVVPIT